MIPKFRAWLKEENKMIEPSDILSISFKLCEMTPNYLHGFEKEKYDFYDLELMQSTGLFDKNGKEIFEGDILKVANNDSSWFEVVKYDHDKAMFISKEMNLKYEVPETPLYDLFSPYLFKVEVIGNIWENPDLLGTKLGSEE